MVNEFQEDAHALPLITEPVGHWHTAVLQHLVGIGGGPHAQLIVFLALAVSRHSCLHEKRRHAPLPQFRHVGKEEHHIADIAVGDEYLGAVEDVIVAVSGRGHLHTADIASRLRFGDGHGPDLFPLHQRRQKLLLLLLGAETVNRCRTQAQVRVQNIGGGGTCFG